MNRQPHRTSTASSPARSQRRRPWRWLLVIASLVGLIVLLPQFVLIQWGPRLLGTFLSKQLHTSVTVEGVAGGWLSGLEVRGIEVAERPESPAPRAVAPGAAHPQPGGGVATRFVRAGCPASGRPHCQRAAWRRRTVEHGGPAGSPEPTDTSNCAPNRRSPLLFQIGALTSR